MLNLAVTLLVIGGVLLLVETFIPGFGVFGITGVVMMVVSAVIMALFVPNGIFIVIGEAAVIALAVYLFVKFAVKRNLCNKLVLLDQAPFEDGDGLDLTSFVGKNGVAVTPLRPVGSADFAGLTVEVCSDGVFVEAGQPVTVVDVRNKRIVVRPEGSSLTAESREN